METGLRPVYGACARRRVQLGGARGGGAEGGDGVGDA